MTAPLKHSADITVDVALGDRAGAGDEEVLGHAHRSFETASACGFGLLRTNGSR